MSSPAENSSSAPSSRNTTATDSKTNWYRHHSLEFVGDGLPWVNASGVANIQSLRVTLAQEDTVERPYTVRLHFAEPDSTAPGERAFDVTLQGAKVLEEFDITSEAGGERRGVVKEFNNVLVRSALELDFESSGPAAPLLCGIEVIAEG